MAGFDADRDAAALLRARLTGDDVAYRVVLAHCDQAAVIAVLVNMVIGMVLEVTGGDTAGLDAAFARMQEQLPAT